MRPKAFIREVPSKQTNLSYFLCDNLWITSTCVHPCICRCKSLNAIFIIEITASPFFDTPIFRTLRNQLPRSRFILLEVAVPTVSRVFHCRANYLKASERLDRSTASIFGEDSKKFFLLNSHLLFVDRHTLCRIIQSRLSELFLRISRIALFDDQKQYSADQPYAQCGANKFSFWRRKQALPLELQQISTKS